MFKLDKKNLNIVIFKCIPTCIRLEDTDNPLNKTSEKN